MQIIGWSYRSISILLTLDEDAERSVYLEVRLWPMSWRGVAAHDLQFLIVVEQRGAPTAQIYCRIEAQQYVDPVREIVMLCVCEAVTRLVENVQPDVIHIVTFVQNPPDNSLPKYQMITDMLESSGYEIVQTGSDQHDRRYWLLVEQETQDA
jgi:hypothetical protein